MTTLHIQHPAGQRSGNDSGAHVRTACLARVEQDAVLWGGESDLAYYPADQACPVCQRISQAIRDADAGPGGDWLLVDRLLRQAAEARRT